MTHTRLKLSQFGKWAELLDGDAAAYAEANHRATMKRGDKIKLALRANIRSAGIRRAGAIANTWQGKGFPRSPKEHADKPAYVIGNKLLTVIEQLADGGDIAFKGGAGVVPMGQGLRILRALPPGTPRTAWLAAARRQFGDRILTRVSKGRLQLGYYEEPAPGKKARFVLLGVIVPRVRGRKLLAHREILAREGRAFGDDVAAETMQLFSANAAERGRRAEFGAVETVIR